MKKKILVSILIAFIIVLIVVASYIIFYKYSEFRNSLRVSIITDLHLCSTDDADLKNQKIEEFLKFVMKIKGDLIVNLGDNLNYDLRNCNDSAEKDAEAIISMFKSVTIPTKFLMGDHDLTSNQRSVDFWRKVTATETPFYSFDIKDFHIIVLDTVLGGENMRNDCENDEFCKAYSEKARYYKDMLEKADSSLSPDIQLIKSERLKYKELLSLEQDEIKQTRSAGFRDRGRISENQLDWLKNDLASTSKNNVLIFSHHPLFKFQPQEKVYDVANADKVRDIMASSRKNIVSISGDTHVWHTEEINGIMFHSIGRHSDQGQFTWGSLVWKHKADQPIIERITAAK